MLDITLNVALGLVLGVLGGLFGIGGGLLAIPVLGILFGLDQQMSQGTALVMVVPNVLLAVWRYHQRNRIVLRDALALAMPGFGCALLGSSLAVVLDPGRMRLAFVIFLLGLAAYTFLRAWLQTASGEHALRHGWPWLSVLGIGSGLIGGLFGVGGGVIATPLLTSLFGASQVVAQGLALALAAPGTAVALATYGAHGQVSWSLGVPLATGGLLSISLGVRLAHTLPERVLRMSFSLFLIASAVLLWLKA